MKHLKNLWNAYKLLGVSNDQSVDAKRRIIMTNMMSLSLALVVVLLSIVLFNLQLPNLLFLGSLLSLAIYLSVPLFNYNKRHTVAAILFSLSIPILVFTTQIIHKMLMPVEQINQSDYYRSNLWLICSVAFPFISVDPRKKGLLIGLSLIPVTMIFGLNLIFGLFEKDFIHLGYDIEILRRQNIVSLMVAIVLIMIFFFLDEINIKLRNELRVKADELEKLSIVAQETTNAVAIFDDKGNFEWVNQGFVKIYEQTMDNLIVTEGSNLFETIPNSYSADGVQKDEEAEEVKLILSAIKDSIALKKPVHYEYNTITKSGRQIIVQTTLTPIMDKEGNIKKLIGIDSDISALKKAEKKIRKQKEEIQSQAEQLKEFNEHLEELVSKRTQKIQEQNKKLLKYAFSNSHEVRAPLAKILGLTELLDANADLSSDERAKLLTNIRTSALELDEVIRNVGEIIADDLPSDENGP